MGASNVVGPVSSVAPALAAAGPWGALAGGLIGAGASWWLGEQAVSERKRAAMEAIRRQDLERAQMYGHQVAAVGASGVEMGSASMQTYLSTMAEEFRREREWSVQQANRGADIQQQTNALEGLSGVGSSLFTFGKSMKWWGGA